ncbi:MAG: beta-propeller fold lactonase family protein [Betaproteobacteria bacterium]
MRSGPSLRRASPSLFDRYAVAGPADHLGVSPTTRAPSSGEVRRRRDFSRTLRHNHAMKKHQLLCLLFAVSTSAHALPACYELDAGSVFQVWAITDFYSCDSPYPDEQVTTHAKVKLVDRPLSYLLDENQRIFGRESPHIRAQLAPKVAAAAQGGGVRDAKSDQSGRYLYVASNATNNVSAYQVDPGTGAVTDVPGAPFPTGKSPAAIAIHPSNRFLYTADFSSDTVSAFSLDPATGALTAIGTIATASLPGSMAMHPSGRYLYVTSAVSPGTSVVQAYAIDSDTGALSVLGSPVSPQAIPFSIVIDPQGKFVYFLGKGIEAFVVGATGALTRVPGIAFTASFGQLAMAPSGRFLYALDPSTRKLSVFAINRTTGALTAIGGSPFATGPNPTWVTVSATGQSVLVADPDSLLNNGTDAIWVWSVDVATGALTHYPGSPFAAQGTETPDVIAVNVVSRKSFAKLGADYSNANFKAVGGTSPYSWSIAGGALPPGLTQNAQTGAVSGAPTQNGTFDFMVKVADATGQSFVLADFITVNDTGLPPGVTAQPTATVVEFYNLSLDHYFITWAPGEIAKLDAGDVIKGWTRTGHSFKTYAVAQSATSPVCRYYIPPALGDSHFFGRGTLECGRTGSSNPSFVLEDPAFMQMFLPVNGVCPAGTVKIYRVFSNRPDANHRYMTDTVIRDEMVAKGWLAEGDGADLVVMCAP